MTNVNKEKAYEYVRSRILSGRYSPGRSLVVNALAPEIGVSRTPIREALLQLESDGLVTVQPRVGASVKAVDLKELCELCGLRQALESYAAGLAARERSEADLQVLHHALETLRRQTERETIREPSQLPIDEGIREDAEFHIAIMRAAKSDLLKKEILRFHLINGVMSAPITLAAEDRSPEFNREAYNARALKTQAEHEAIYFAIERRDADAAEAAMRHHLQNVSNVAARVMLRNESDSFTHDLRHAHLHRPVASRPGE